MKCLVQDCLKGTFLIIHQVQAAIHLLEVPRVAVAALICDQINCQLVILVSLHFASKLRKPRKPIERTQARLTRLAVAQPNQHLEHHPNTNLPHLAKCVDQQQVQVSITVPIRNGQVSTNIPSGNEIEGVLSSGAFFQAARHIFLSAEWENSQHLARRGSIGMNGVFNLVGC